MICVLFRAEEVRYDWSPRPSVYGYLSSMFLKLCIWTCVLDFPILPTNFWLSFLLLSAFLVFHLFQWTVRDSGDAWLHFCSIDYPILLLGKKRKKKSQYKNESFLQVKQTSYSCMVLQNEYNYQLRVNV